MFSHLQVLVCALPFTAILFGGCTAKHDHMHGHEKALNAEALVVKSSERQISLGLAQAALEVHQAVMQDHLKAVHEIVAALAEERFERAQDLTETRLGFAKHREAMGQQKAEDFPPVYHDLAMAHHQAAEDLAMVIPSKNLKRILPHFERTLKACVQCHEKFKQ